jgi:hypothetical protein
MIRVQVGTSGAREGMTTQGLLGDKTKTRP